MRVLVVNAGASSLKRRVLDEDGEVAATPDLPVPRGGSVTPLSSPLPWAESKGSRQSGTGACAAAARSPIPR